jgi:hypothetical protein
MKQPILLIAITILSIGGAQAQLRSEGSDSVDLFAIELFDEIQPRSIEDNVEYCGYIGYDKERSGHLVVFSYENLHSPPSFCLAIARTEAHDDRKAAPDLGLNSRVGQAELFPIFTYVVNVIFAVAARFEISPVTGGLQSPLDVPYQLARRDLKLLHEKLPNAFRERRHFGVSC